jgi:hypothetical protein
MPLDIEVVIVFAVIAAAVGYWLWRRRAPSAASKADDSRERDNIDTVIGWPPEVTRLLSGGERAAHDTLVKALPECLVFAQVPLARFIRVPRRNSYGDWLTRVGHLSADFLICDRASLVIGAVSLQSAQESARAAQRRARMAKVLKAAGIKVFIWREQSIPSPAAARDQIIQRTGVPSTLVDDASSIDTGREKRSAGPLNGKLPVPEVVAEVPMGGPRQEPPSSTWFDDLDSGPPFDPSRKRGET